MITRDSSSPCMAAVCVTWLSPHIMASREHWTLTSASPPPALKGPEKPEETDSPTESQHRADLSSQLPCSGVNWLCSLRGRERSKVTMLRKAQMCFLGDEENGPLFGVRWTLTFLTKTFICCCLCGSESYTSLNKEPPHSTLFQVTNNYFGWRSTLWNWIRL